MATEQWLCISVSIPNDAVEAVSNFLVELGSVGTVEGEWKPGTPRPARTTVQGFFSVDQDATSLQAHLSNYLHSISSEFPAVVGSIPASEVLSSHTWQEQWKGHFPPLPVGQQFLILPPWESKPEKSARQIIEINPSMAFGTGHHATTQTCLEAIESLCLTYGPPARALDIGTGSGVLAIALAKLGTPAIWATDIDPDAREEAQKNAIVNDVATAIHTSSASLHGLPSPFQLIVANIFASTLIELHPSITAAVSPAGYAVLSGIQIDQTQSVLDAFFSPVWTLIQRLPKDDWMTLVLQRDSN